MDLIQKLLDPNTKNRRQFLRQMGFGMGLGILGTIPLLTNCSKVDVTTPDEIDVDTKHIGMIEGKVAVPKISDNRITYVGKEGIEVIIDETKFKTFTIGGGTYSIDNIPSGSYMVKANPKQNLYGYDSGQRPVTVVKQDVVNVGQINLIPNGSNPQGHTDIIYGLALDKSGNRYSNKRITMNEGANSTNREIASTVTSSDGSYAFYNPYSYVSSGISPPLKFTSQDGDFTVDGQSSPSCRLDWIINGLVNKNIRLV